MSDYTFPNGDIETSAAYDDPGHKFGTRDRLIDGKPSTGPVRLSEALDLTLGGSRTNTTSGFGPDGPGSRLRFPKPSQDGQ